MWEKHLSSPGLFAPMKHLRQGQQPKEHPSFSNPEEAAGIRCYRCTGRSHPSTSNHCISYMGLLLLCFSTPGITFSMGIQLTGISPPPGTEGKKHREWFIVPNYCSQAEKGISAFWLLAQRCLHPVWNSSLKLQGIYRLLQQAVKYSMYIFFTINATQQISQITQGDSASLQHRLESALLKHRNTQSHVPFRTAQTPKSLFRSWLNKLNKHKSN